MHAQVSNVVWLFGAILQTFELKVTELRPTQTVMLVGAELVTEFGPPLVGNTCLSLPLHWLNFHSSSVIPPVLSNSMLTLTFRRLFQSLPRPNVDPIAFREGEIIRNSMPGNEYRYYRLLLDPTATSGADDLIIEVILLLRWFLFADAFTSSRIVMR